MAVRQCSLCNRIIRPSRIGARERREKVRRGRGRGRKEHRKVGFESAMMSVLLCWVGMLVPACTRMPLAVLPWMDADGLNPERCSVIFNVCL